MKELSASAVRSALRSTIATAALGGLVGGSLAAALELGRRHHAPLNADRVTAALVGGFVGWLLHVALRVDLLRLVVPSEPPHSFLQAMMTALVIGALSGTITAISGAEIYRAKTYTVHPILRLTVGGLILGASGIRVLEDGAGNRNRTCKVPSTGGF